MPTLSPHQWPDHLLSLDEWQTLPPADRHCELAEGVLVVSPRPAAGHQWLVTRLAALLNSALPDELAALPEVEVVIDGGDVATVRVPDLVVAPFPAAEQTRLADVVLVCEVVSPGSRGTDRVTKVAEYAAAGVPHYWIVDREAHEILVLRLDGDAYRTVSRGGRVTVDAPVPLRVDLTDLAGRR